MAIGPAESTQTFYTQGSHLMNPSPFSLGLVYSHCQTKATQSELENVNRLYLHNVFALLLCSKSHNPQVEQLSVSEGPQVRVEEAPLTNIYLGLLAIVFCLSPCGFVAVICGLKVSHD